MSNTYNDYNIDGNLSDYDRDSARDAYDYKEVIYYAEADDIINEHESTHWRDAEDITSGQTFDASDWLQAKMAYANALYYCAQSAQIEADLDEIEERIELFRDECEAIGQGCDPDAATFDGDCAYGWEAHNYETAEGVMVWGAPNPHDSTNNYNPHKLEGELYAISFKLTDGLWLNLAWTPEAEEEEDEDEDEETEPA